jgi:predicted HicB family RNase H-like nuclease
METKLTLRLDEKLIGRAKSYARKSRKSVSQLVADYFSVLGARAGERNLPR